MREHHPLRHPRAAWLASLCLAALPLAVAAQEVAVLNFQVQLDGKPIGTHVFRVNGPDTARTVASEAAFDVKLLGVTVYRYRHQAREQWAGDCLAELDAQTEDGSDSTRIRARLQGGALLVEGPGAPQRLPACVMGFAYWHPALRQQTRLLDPQSGRLENVQVREAEAGTLEAGGRTVPARRWRIEGPASPITVWYGMDGRWLGLDAELRGGRQLRYRLP